MNSLVTCIVINWNLKKETLHCLSSIQNSTIACRIILVDNGSEDGSVKEISKQFPDIITIQLSNNIGFGRACNLGIQYALRDSECQYILLLNNDAFINPTTIETLLITSSTYPNAGIFGPIIYDQKKPTHIWYAGAQRRPGILSMWIMFLARLCLFGVQFLKKLVCSMNASSFTWKILISVCGLKTLVFHFCLFPRHKYGIMVLLRLLTIWRYVATIISEALFCSSENIPCASH